MIAHLGIRDLGVIDSAGIDLGEGLTVVTGETGAGKTMFVTALDLLVGGRAEARAVRNGAAKAVVEGVFAHPGAEVTARITDAGGDLDEDEAILTRSVSSAGRSRATAGGRTVPVGLLKDVGSHMVNMHGQAVQMTLKTPATHRALLDEYGGRDLAGALEEYRRAFAAYKDLEAEHTRLVATSTERADRIAYLSASLERIDEVRPLAGEDTELKAVSSRLSAAAELTGAVGAAHTLLVGDDYSESTHVTGLFEQVTAEISRAATMDETLEPHLEALTDLALQVSDRSAALAGYLAGFEDLGESSLEEIEARRAELGSLSAYGEDVEAVLAFETRAGAELLELQAGDEALEEMDAKLAAASAEVTRTGAELTRLRREAAGRFSSAVSRELTALAMPQAEVSFEIAEAEAHAHGTDHVRMAFRAHAGTQPGDIGTLASGGELSRVMLAIEVVKAERVPFGTFVFDEVDAGVGGKAAIEIGRRLARLAATSQVIVVTHLPQVAAWADHHLTVVKDDSSTSAVSGVRDLDDPEKVAELARMLAGLSDSDSARAHAEELKEMARTEKAEYLGTGAALRG